MIHLTFIGRFPPYRGPGYLTPSLSPPITMRIRFLLSGHFAFLLFSLRTLTSHPLVTIDYILLLFHSRSTAVMGLCQPFLETLWVCGAVNVYRAVISGALCTCGSVLSEIRPSSSQPPATFHSFLRCLILNRRLLIVQRVLLRPAIWMLNPLSRFWAKVPEVVLVVYSTSPPQEVQCEVRRRQYDC